MALWLIRAGSHGEFEEKFLTDERVYLTWEGLDIDLNRVQSRDDLREEMGRIYPEASAGKLTNHTAQVWAFASRMAKGDWFVLPSKMAPAIHVGEIRSDYEYDASSESLYRHSRKVRWIEVNVPRSNFEQDLLYSFGAFLTICQVTRNDAEERVRAMADNGWREHSGRIAPSSTDDADTEAADSDLEEIARDRLAKYIIAKFKGHGLARLVGEILKAQGYTVYKSPAGPDGGVDLLAAPGSMGFGSPRICVQVKSEQSPIERVVLDQLVGTMQGFQADQGLLVSWGGFKKSYDQERPRQFFRVRLWNRDDLIEQLIANYDRLDEDLRAEIPLKQIWTLALADESGE